MTTILNDIEIRILAALVEKQLSTPEYYPLTLNALTLAANQKNNRNPVTSYTEIEVAHALETLREKNLTYVFHGSTSRVPKYKHVMPEVMHLNRAELAIMCLLMLRGPQTVGELRSHAGRLFEFSGLEEVDVTVNGLMSRDPEPFVVRLQRQPGQKDARYAHLLSGEPPASELPGPPTRARTTAAADKIAMLEAEVESLKSQMNELREQFDRFKQQFD